MIKKTPISEHKEKDVKLMRKILLEIIEDEDISKKERIEASKLLLRAHHSLAPDRTVTAKAVAQTQKVDVKLTKEEQKEIEGLLSA